MGCCSSTHQPTLASPGIGDATTQISTAEGVLTAALHARRAQICAESVEFDAEYVKKVIPKSDESRSVIDKALRDHFLFTGLKDEQIGEILDAMEERRVATGEKIISQGKRRVHI